MKQAIYAAATMALLAGCGRSTSTPGSKVDASASLRLPAGDIVAGENLVSFAKAKGEYRPKDQFDKGFDDSPLDGRHFLIRRSLFGPSAFTTVTYMWSYDRETQTLKFDVDPSPSGGPPPNLGLEVFREEKVGQPKPESNAYGTTKQVTPTTEFSVAVGALQPENMGVLPVDSTYAFLSDRILYKRLEKEVKLDPDRARVVTSTLKIEISGVVHKAANGHIIECSDLHIGATLSDPLEQDVRKCSVNVKLDRITFRSETGGVLAEWK